MCPLAIITIVLVGGDELLLFSSTVFLFLFLPLTLLIYYNPFVTSRRFRNLFLLIASLGSYAWGEPIFVFLMMLSICVSWYTGLKLDAVSSYAAKKRVLWIGASFHIHNPLPIQISDIHCRTVRLLIAS